MSASRDYMMYTCVCCPSYCTLRDWFWGI